LGYAYYRKREYDRAVDEYRRELTFLSSTDHGLRERTLIELHQKLSAVYDALGDTEQAARFGQMAIDEFERRLAAGADDPATRYYVAAVYARRGDLDNTLKHLALPLAQLPLFTPWRLQRDPDFDRVRHHATFADKAGSSSKFVRS
jgi:tetratricopeptide (TPR) repeat protein